MTLNQRKIVRAIVGGARYEKTMEVVSGTIEHEVYEYVKVEKLIEIIRVMATRKKK